MVHKVAKRGSSGILAYRIFGAVWLSCKWTAPLVVASRTPSQSLPTRAANVDDAQTRSPAPRTAFVPSIEFLE